MGKNKDKNQEEIPNLTSVTNRDILQRLNFLYQASVLLNGLAPPDAIQCDDDPSKSSMTSNDNGTGAEDGNLPLRPPKSRKTKRRRVVSLTELSRSYVETMKNVGQKTNVKMDPSVKRRICKRCYAPLLPGVSATVRIKDSVSHGQLISYKCHCCQTERRIPAPPILHINPLTNAEATEAQSGTMIEVSAASVPDVTTNTGDGNAVRRKRKKGPKPRFPPHFARDVGHVMFRGTELLEKTHSTVS